MTTFI